MVVIIVALHLCGDSFKRSLVRWVICTKWHLSYDPSITIGAAKLNLPSNWWVTWRDEKAVQLNRVTPLRYGLFGHLGHIFIQAKHVGKDELNRYEPERDLGGMRAVRTGGIETSTIDGEAVYSIKYKVISPAESKDTIIWALSVPSRSLVVTVFCLYEGQEAMLASELFSKIRFVERGQEASPDKVR